LDGRGRRTVRLDLQYKEAIMITLSRLARPALAVSTRSARPGPVVQNTRFLFAVDGIMRGPAPKTS